MKSLTRLFLLHLALLIMIGLSWQQGDSYCVIFPQNGRDIFGVAQRNIIVYDEDEVSLIPQLNFQGDARDFGIFVPVPAEPHLSTVGANIFSEASFLTQPVIRQSSDGCGCDESDQIVGPQFLNSGVESGLVVDDASGGVTIIYEQTVGMFAATVLQAGSADDLISWLQVNDYRFRPEDAPLLEEYVAQNWFFVAMKLDTTQVPPVISQWWSATTSPAKITFAHSGGPLTYPLKISSISTEDRMEVLVYTIGPEPIRFPDARVEYQNLLDDDEMRAILERYPALGKLIEPGQFITKLRRIFDKKDMQEDVQLTPTTDRSEYREVRYVRNSGFGWLGMAIFALALYLTKRKK